MKAFPRRNAISVWTALGLFAVSHSAICFAQSQVVGWYRNDYGQTNVPAAVSNALAISSGGYHVLTLQNDGTVLAWGADYAGQIDVPAGLSNVVAVAAGGAHSMALKSDGTIVTWGWNAYNQLNIPAGLSNVVAIVGGVQHSIVLKGDGTVVAWGNPSGGSPGSVVPADLKNVRAIAASYHQNLALKGDGTVAAWGSDAGLTNVPAGLNNVVAIAAANDANLALKSDGSLVVWGYGANTTNIPSGLNNVVAIAGGYSDFMALKSDGTVVVWGDNGYGETNVPPGLTNVGAIVGGDSDCLVLEGNGLPQITQSPFNETAAAESSVLLVGNAFGLPPLTWQWKYNGTNLPGATASTLLLTNLQLAQSGLYSLTATNSLGGVESAAATLSVVPSLLTTQPTNQTLYYGDTLTVSVQGPGPVTYQWQFEGVTISGATNATLVLTGLATNYAGAYSVIVCNPYGCVTNYAFVQSVFDLAPFFTLQPTNRSSWPGGSAAFQVSANGSKPITYQWRFNGADIPGATTTSLSLSNLVYQQTGNYSARATNARGNGISSNALLSVLSVITWGGTNSYGLGVIPADLTNAIAIAGGVNHSVGLKSDGRVVAWGYNFNNQTTVPASATNVIAIAAGGSHSLALKSNGTLVAWGEIATVPAGLSNVIGIAASESCDVALKSDGTVAAWGMQFSPTNIPAGLSNVIAVTAAQNFIAALKSDGTVTNWGSSPVSTAGMTNVVQISANAFPLGALRTNRTVASAGTSVPPATMTNIVSLAAGRYFIAALRADGVVTNWGSPPIWPAGLSNIVAIASGENHCLAILGSGPPLPQVLLSNPRRNLTNFSFSLPTDSGKVYGTEYKTSLTDIAWSPLPLVAGNGTLLTVTNSTATNSQRFYRVKRW
jgi:alpha-tubulin suppressor-like RCC1 family protein